MIGVRFVPRQPPGPRWSDGIVLAAALVLLVGASSLLISVLL